MRSPHFDQGYNAVTAYGTNDTNENKKNSWDYCKIKVGLSFGEMLFIIIKQVNHTEKAVYEKTLPKFIPLRNSNIP